MAVKPRPGPWAMKQMGRIFGDGEPVCTLQVGDAVVVSDIVHQTQIMGKDSVTYPFGMGPDRGGLRGCQSEHTPLIHGLWLASFSPAPMLTVTFAPIGEYLPVPYGEATYFVFAFNSTRDTRLLAAYSAFLRGTLRVYVVNSVSERLGITEFLGTVQMNFVNRDAVEETLRHEPKGVACSADCVGIEAVNVTIHLDQGIVLRTTIIVAATDVPLADRIRNHVPFPLGTTFSKSLSYRAGAVDPLDAAPELLQLIPSRQADPSFIITSQIDVEETPDPYSWFDRRLETKVIIRFS
ncbi:hypothetical protein BJX68DRAFT_262112 [Aspergillus pseudodeflectus]|uniref:Uncharacterized protein n=1 Tax=Aspergillus pseudodeflectus TaxID=176178 RepID=A0ABR4L571_9EURO